MGAHLADELGLPHIWHIREFGELDYRQKFNLGRKNFLKWLDKAATVVAISHVIRKEAIPEAKAPVEVIYNGVMPLAAMVDGGQKNGGEPAYDFMIVGALQPEKGQETAVRAFQAVNREHPETRLAIVGDAPTPEYPDYLKALCRELGLEKQVVFTGYVPDPIPLYQQTKVLLMCSQHEAMGRTTAEAMALGLPVIGYRGGATPELVEDGQTGLLYASLEELQGKMLELLQNPAKRAAMGKAGQARARQLFSVESCAKAMWGSYQKALKG